MGEIGDELAHLLEGVGLHEDVVLGEQQGGDLAQLAHGRRVRVRDHVPVRGACVGMRSHEGVCFKEQ